MAFDRFVPGFMEGLRKQIHDHAKQAEGNFKGRTRKRLATCEDEEQLVTVAQSLNFGGEHMGPVEQAIRAFVREEIAAAGQIPNQPSQPVSSQPTQTAPAQDLANCFKCHKPGKELNGPYGVFWVCSDKACGYVTKTGEFKQSNWNAGNWQERFERQAKFANQPSY